MTPEKLQISALPEDHHRIRNTVTCGESCRVPFEGNQKAAAIFLSEVLTRIPNRWELDEEAHVLMVYPV